VVGMTASSPEEIAAAKQFGLTFDFYFAMQ
jgi:hypothetical protein